MRFMIIVRATAESETETAPAVDTELLDEMVAYHQQLSEAGVLLDGAGLLPSRDGWRIRYSGGQRTVTDGPFGEVKELIAGYTVIQVPSREAAMEWARRFPSPFGPADCEIEVRRLWETKDFPPCDAINSLRQITEGQPG
ncbi:MAG TPA: YciI family protein [Rubrivivax sp.]|nr:YciI family protein [Rubrivivax sp.]